MFKRSHYYWNFFLFLLYFLFLDFYFFGDIVCNTFSWTNWGESKESKNCFIDVVGSKSKYALESSYDALNFVSMHPLSWRSVCWHKCYGYPTLMGKLPNILEVILFEVYAIFLLNLEEKIDRTMSTGCNNTLDPSTAQSKSRTI